MVTTDPKIYRVGVVVIHGFKRMNLLPFHVKARSPKSAKELVQKQVVGAIKVQVSEPVAIDVVSAEDV